MKNYIVFYIDLLGTSQNIVNGTGDKIFKLIKCQFDLAKKMCEQKNIGFDKIQMKTFSDNIIICIEVDNEERLYEYYYSYLSFFIHIFTYRFIELGILFRGGISYGKFYIDDMMVWGEALVKAVRLEENEADYPRILFDETFVRLMMEKYDIDESSMREDLYCIKDENDEKLFFDCIDYSNLDTTEQYIKNTKSIIMSRMNKSNESVKRKIEWFDNYLENALDYFLDKKNYLMI